MKNGKAQDNCISTNTEETMHEPPGSINDTTHLKIPDKFLTLFEAQNVRINEVK